MTSDVNRSIEEQLSAFLDDELRDEELDMLVRRLERNEEYRATLARYSLIANVVRNDPVHTYPNQFRDKIMAAIAAENTPAAPAASARQRLISGWRVPFASVAAIVLVMITLSSAGVQGWFSAGDNGELKSPRIASVQQSVDAGAPPTTRWRPATSVASRQARLDPQRLSSYMVAHREYAQPLHGPIANSRIVVQQVRFEE